MGNSLSADSYLDQDACSGRNLTWQYIRYGSLPEPYSHCPNSAGILAAHNCKEGSCKPSLFDKEFGRYTWKFWDGLGQPDLAGGAKSSTAPAIVGFRYGTHKEPYKPDDDSTASRTQAKRGLQCALPGGDNGNERTETRVVTRLGQSYGGVNECHRLGGDNGQQQDQKPGSGPQEPKVQDTVVEVPTTERKVPVRLRSIFENELSSSRQPHPRTWIKARSHEKTISVRPYIEVLHYDWPSTYKPKPTRHPQVVQNLGDAYPSLTTSTDKMVATTSQVHVVAVPTHFPPDPTPKQINWDGKTRSKIELCKRESPDSAPAFNSTTFKVCPYGMPEFKDDLRKRGGLDYIDYLGLQAKLRKNTYEAYTLQRPAGRTLRSHRHQRSNYSGPNSSDPHWTKANADKPHLGRPKTEPCGLEDMLEAPGLASEVCGPWRPPQISAAEPAIARNNLSFFAFWLIVLCCILGCHYEHRSGPPAPKPIQVTIELRESDKVWGMINSRPRARRTCQDSDDVPDRDSGYHSDDDDDNDDQSKPDQSKPKQKTKYIGHKPQNPGKPPKQK